MLSVRPSSWGGSFLATATTVAAAVVDHARGQQIVDLEPCAFILMMLGRER